MISTLYIIKMGNVDQTGWFDQNFAALQPILVVADKTMPSSN